MAWQLAFLDEALKEWRKLDSATASQFKKKLAERLENPRPNCVLTESSKHKQFDQNQGSGAQLRFRGNETRSRVPASRLHGSKERYKIKLRSSGYRL
nr:hypothetical protein [Hyphomonadaceae bacterium]